MKREIIILFVAVVVAVSCSTSRMDVVDDFLPEGSFTIGIEGPAVDSAGNIYAVNYLREGTIGRVSPEGRAEVFIDLRKCISDSTTANGIRFGIDGAMYVADYVGHNILRVDMQTREVGVFAHSPLMSQPNDLAIAPGGAIYASDPSWATGTGRLWRVEPMGGMTLLRDSLGTTNGIEVSVCGSWLYVGESEQRRILKYPILVDGSLGESSVFAQFDDFGLDGMRCDEQGNLYVTRYGKGTVVVLNPEGELLREIRLKGAKPSNITFAGARVYVTLADRGCFETFEVPIKGRE